MTTPAPQPTPEQRASALALIVGFLRWIKTQPAATKEAA